MLSYCYFFVRVSLRTILPIIDPIRSVFILPVSEDFLEGHADVGVIKNKAFLLDFFTTDPLAGKKKIGHLTKNCFHYKFRDIGKEQRFVYRLCDFFDQSVVRNGIGAYTVIYPHESIFGGKEKNTC